MSVPSASGGGAASDLRVALFARLFDAEETELFAKGLAHLTQSSPPDADFMREQLAHLVELGHVTAEMPSLRKPRTLRGQTRDAETIATYLRDTRGFASELTLPLKAVVSRTFLVAKIHFLRGFQVSVSSQSTAPDPMLHRRFGEELGQSIYTYLAEEILVSLLGVPDIPTPIKQRAAEQLTALWEDAPMLEVDDFCPLLESAWRARCRVAAGLGSLLGTAEYFRLLQNDCAPRFLDFFTRADVSEEENHSFEEFLFGLTYEDLGQLRSTMSAEQLHVIDPTRAARALSVPEEDLVVVDDPYALYRSFCRRRLAAEFRTLARRQGPRRVAEAYLMIFLLETRELGPRG